MSEKLLTRVLKSFKNTVIGDITHILHNLPLEVYNSIVSSMFRVV